MELSTYTLSKSTILHQNLPFTYMLISVLNGAMKVVFNQYMYHQPLYNHEQFNPKITL